MDWWHHKRQRKKEEEKKEGENVFRKIQFEVSFQHPPTNSLGIFVMDKFERFFGILSFLVLAARTFTLRIQENIFQSHDGGIFSAMQNDLVAENLCIVDFTLKTQNEIFQHLSSLQHHRLCST